MSDKFVSSYSYKLIYVFRINDKAHEGLLKIGDATLKTDESIDRLSPNCRLLNQAAKERINSYTNTAGVTYDLLHTELAVRTDIKKELSKHSEITMFTLYWNIPALKRQSSKAQKQENGLELTLIPLKEQQKL